MANTYTSLKLSYDTAYRFHEDFSSTDHSVIKYIFVGNSNEYVDENTPDSILDNLSDEKTIWDNMYAGKRVTGNDVQLVIPKVNWTGNTKYIEFDDTILLSDLLTGNTTQNLKPFYVITSENNVYKCLSNNISSNSTIEPTGTYTTSNGFISTSDGYLWKYMFNVRDSNKFFTGDWIPTPTSIAEKEFTLSSDNLVDGALAHIVVANSGSNYYETNVVATAFSSGVTTLTLSNMSNVSANMSVSGNGILSGTYITSLSLLSNTIVLSSSTISTGGGSNNEISLKTRVYVDGDGNDDIVARAVLANDTIQKIEVTSIGTGYSRANVFVYGTGNNAIARAVLSPKYGHGFNPARELFAKNVMVSMKIGEIDSTENGLISSNTSFRQYGLLSAPHKYNESTYVSLANANTVISQTNDITVTAGADYTLGEIVYQGVSVAGSTFSGRLHAQGNNVIRLTNVKGSVTIGGTLKGNTSSTSRTVVSMKNPEFEPYTGDILYVQNVTAVQRADGQAENIKFVIKF